ncbi:MAG: hypothetical protein QHH15_07955, partial [Candidatus Thermoplasmatota archaeon]|nr:hypothetical protein [Candidatus Thermoplasmatota archaeon]
KGLLAGSIDYVSMNKHGAYQKFIEESGFDDKSTLTAYVMDMVQSKSKIFPRVRVKIEPTFEINEGDVVYTFIPSLGIERSLQVYDFSINSTGECEISLGKPSLGLDEKLKRLNSGQKLGLRRGTQSLDEIVEKSRALASGPVFKSASGRFKVTGRDLVSGVNSLWERDANGNLIWITEDIVDKVTLTDEGVVIDSPFPANTTLKFPLGFDLRHEKFESFSNLYVKYNDTTSAPGTLNVKIFADPNENFTDPPLFNSTRDLMVGESTEEFSISSLVPFAHPILLITINYTEAATTGQIKLLEVSLEYSMAQQPKP